MKKQYIAAFACILAAACSKAELNEVDPGSSGESMTLTLHKPKSLFQEIPINLNWTMKSQPLHRTAAGLL